MKHSVYTMIIVWLLAAGLVSPAVAGQVRELGWTDLIERVEFEDPFESLSQEQLSDLGLLIRIRWLIAENKTEPDGSAAKEAKEIEQRLTDAGIDIEWLISQRERVAKMRQKQALAGTQSIDGMVVRLPGYVLPLTYDDELVTEFLLVPWVGACIHTPPPPPNQIVYVRSPEGIEYQGRFAPVWLTGRIETKSGEYDLFLVDGSAKITVGYTFDTSLVQKYSAAESDALANVVVPLSSTDHTWSQNMQMRVSAIFTTTMTNIRDRQSIMPLLVGLLIAFLYGVVHTVGPGHGKAVVVSYFVGEGGSLGRGVRFGTQIAVFHVLAAVVVAVLADFVVQQTTGRSPASFQIVRLLSYASIAAIGGFMLFGAIRGASKHNQLHHEHGCSCHAHRTKRAGGLLSMAIGAVPCTGALMVLLYGIANDLLIKSVLMVFAISLGMAITLSAIGIAAILGRRFIESRLQKKDTHQQRFLTGLKMAGATCVLLIGISLFVYTLRGKMPGASAGLYRDPQQQVMYQDERDRWGKARMDLEVGALIKENDRYLPFDDHGPAPGIAVARFDRND
jgi:ABC-type nickel/cobalt efflux system permease component RcnA